MRSVRIARFPANAATKEASKAEPVVLWTAAEHEVDADQVRGGRKVGRSTGSVQGLEVLGEVVPQVL
jgi:hypothetical protein